jgi:superoxide dismutase, Cu-Zn family
MTHPALALVVSLAVGGCAAMTQPATTGNTATADMRSAAGQSIGTATLTEVPGGVRIVIEVKDLPPGQKGVHIHEAGKCEGPQFTSAGEHFNPGKKQHGTMNPQGAHAGDLPNISINGYGVGRLETTTARITLAAGTNSVLDADGSAIVIHAAPDDFRTDPTGNSGGRSACGVIVKKAS